jgi:membrane-associated protease RseP (regulator of RpoE activity)
MLKSKKRTEVQKILFPFLYFILYRTKVGLKAMDRIAKKCPKLLNVIAYISITISFLGMIFILFFLIKGAYGFFFQNQPSPVGLILPGVSVPGLPKLSFFHWIIAIFILALVHEFSHGVFARLYNIKIKSSGFAFFGIILPIIPAAFVEPDEKQLSRSSKKKQLAVLSGGSFANIITALIFMLIAGFIMVPAVSSVIELRGIQIASVEENSPADQAGLQPGEVILSINNVEVKNLEEFIKELNKTAPHQRITLQTQNNTYTITLATNPQNTSKSYMGVQLMPAEKGFKTQAIEKYGKIPLQILVWLSILVKWIFIANLGVGLFNLLPFGPLDGGKMFHLVLLHVLKDEQKAKIIWSFVTIILVILLVILIAPQLFNLLISPILSLF